MPSMAAGDLRVRGKDSASRPVKAPAWNQESALRSDNPPKILDQALRGNAKEAGISVASGARMSGGGREAPSVLRRGFRVGREGLLSNG